MPPHDPDYPSRQTMGDFELPFGELDSGMPDEELRPTLPQTPLPDEDDDADAIDFGDLPPAEGGSAALSRSQLIGPLSGASIVSWAELLKARQAEEARQQAEIEKRGKPIDVDSESDQDLLHRFLAEEESFNPNPMVEEESVDLFSRPDSGGPSDPSNPIPAELSGRYRFPRSDIASPSDVYRRDSFDAGAPTDQIGLPSKGPIPSVDMTQLLSSLPRDRRPPSDPTGPISDASILNRGPDSAIDLLDSPLSDFTNSAAQMSKTDEVPYAGVPSDDEMADLGIFGEPTQENSAVDLGSQAAIDLPFPMAVDSSIATAVSRPISRRGQQYEDSGAVDLVSVSREDTTNISPPRSQREPLRGAPSSAGSLVPQPAAAGGRASLGSGIAGAAAGIAVCAGLWISGAVPQPPNLFGGGSGAAQVGANTPLDAARAAMEVGDLAKAQAILAPLPASPPVVVERGKVQWFQYLKQCRAQRTPPKSDSPEAQKVREELNQAASDPMAALWLGLIQESCGRTKEALQIYNDAAGRYPDRKELFNAALNRLESRPPSGSASLKRPADPQLGMALFAILLQAGPGVDPSLIPEEAGFKFWEAMKLASDHDYPAAKTALKQARAAHDARRFLLAKRGMNPLSDPLEDIFLRSCDELNAYFDVREQLHTSGYNLVANKTANKAVSKVLSEFRRANDDAKAARAAMTVVRDQVQRAGLDANDIPTSVRTMAQNSIGLANARREAREARDKVAKLEEELQVARAAAPVTADPKMAEQVKALEAALTQAKGERSRLESKVGELEKQLAAGNPDQGKRVQNLETQLAAANRQMGQLREQIKQLESRPAPGGDPMLAARMKSLQSELEKATELKGELETKLKELEQRPTADALVSVERERDEARRQAERARADKAKFEQQQQDLQAKLTAVTQQAALFGQFVSGVAEKLQAAPGAKPDELLGALDQALAAMPPAASDAPAPQLPPVPASVVRAADRDFSDGLSAFQGGRFAEAEAAFRRAIGVNPRDARYHYYLGLALSNQGRDAEAAAELRAGRELERQALPGPSVIDGMLERIQGPARAAFDRARG